MESVPTIYFFYASALLFSLGVFLTLTRRNVVAVLMGVELVLNAANLNFVAFGREGQTTAVFIIVVAAAEAAVALAIVLLAYRKYKTVVLDDISDLKK